MRNFKITKRTKPIFISKAAFVNVTLLAGIAIFIGLAAATGKLVSDNMVHGTVTPSDKVVMSSGSTQTTGDRKTVEITAQDFYFLQFGVFSNKDNATTCANSVIKKGGAGYIKEIEDKNYVFAMSYSQSEDAKTVVSQLKQQGYSAILKCYSHGGLKVELSGAKESVDKVESAFKGMSDIPFELERIVYSFDKGETDKAGLEAALNTLSGKIQTYSDVFNIYSDQNKVFADAVMYCDAVCDDIKGVEVSEEENTPSSDLKFIYINCIFNLIEYLDNVVIE